MILNVKLIVRSECNRGWKVNFFQFHYFSVPQSPLH